MDQLIMKMLDPKQRQQAVSNQLVHTLMPDHAPDTVIVGEFIINLVSAKLRSRLEKLSIPLKKTTETGQIDQSFRQSWSPFPPRLVTRSGAVVH